MHGVSTPTAGHLSGSLKRHLWLDMQDQIVELRRQLEEVRQEKEEAERRQEEERRAKDEERRAREEAERRQAEAERRLQPNSLVCLLDHCHKYLLQEIRVETDATLTT